MRNLHPQPTPYLEIDTFKYTLKSVGQRVYGQLRNIHEFLCRYVALRHSWSVLQQRQRSVSRRSFALPCAPYQVIGSADTAPQFLLVRLHTTQLRNLLKFAKMCKQDVCLQQFLLYLMSSSTSYCVKPKLIACTAMPLN